MRIWLVLGLLLACFALAQDPDQPPPPDPGQAEAGVYVVGRIVSIGTESATVRVGGELVQAQLPTADAVALGTGPRPGGPTLAFRAGQSVVLYRSGGQSFITEPYRISYLWGLLALFVLVVGLLGRGKGLRGLIGTIGSMLMLALWIVPEIARGNNPLLVTFVGSFFILVLSIYFVHGINRKTSAALAGTALSSLVALVLAVLVTEWTQFTGLTSEEAFLARFALGSLDLVSLYLAAVVVGALGALNDVTVTQASVVQALVQANPRYTVRELYSRGMSVGFDHIGSLVNTLVLAYAAGSLPLLLLVHQSDVPLNLLLNQEPFAAEMVSMLLGSLALVLAVPLTTLIAAWLLRGRKLDYLDSRWPSQSERRSNADRSVSALLGEDGKEDKEGK